MLAVETTSRVCCFNSAAPGPRLHHTNSDRVGSNDEYDRRRGCGFACLRRFADELTYPPWRVQRTITGVG
jgi:hypothetical protein